MQTAIEYIFEQLEEQGLIFLTTKTNEMTISISASDYLDIKRLAKQLEKQQIIDAYWGGLNGSINDYSESKKVGSEIIDIKYGKGADQYYNETYGSKGSDVMTPENHIGVLSEAVKKETTSSQTEISDEEIEKGAENAWSDYEYKEGNLYYTTFKGGWKYAIKWYREQLKQR